MFNRKIVQKDISQYEKLKKTLYNNKKVLNMKRLKTMGIELPQRTKTGFSPEKTISRKEFEVVGGRGLKEKRLSSV